MLFCLFYICYTRSLLPLSPGSGFTFFLVTATQPRLRTTSNFNIPANHSFLPHLFLFLCTGWNILQCLRNGEYFFIILFTDIYTGSIFSCFACSHMYQSPVGLWPTAGILNCICIDGLVNGGVLVFTMLQTYTSSKSGLSARKSESNSEDATISLRMVNKDTSWTCITLLCTFKH